MQTRLLGFNVAHKRMLLNVALGNSVNYRICYILNLIYTAYALTLYV